jgi:hypothetical protein
MKKKVKQYKRKEMALRGESGSRREEVGRQRNDGKGGKWLSYKGFLRVDNHISK